MMRRMVFSLLALSALGCGQEQGLAALGATLLVPRQLAERLKTVEVFLFKTNNNAPACEDLLDPAKFETLRQSIFMSTKIDFDSTQDNKAVLEGIPDYGRVWRPYVRGYDDANVMIAQGCRNIELYLVEAGKTTAVEITLQTYTPP